MPCGWAAKPIPVRCCARVLDCWNALTGWRLSCTAEQGQGLITVLQMIVAEEFCVPPERVRVLVMDTDLTPDGGPTTASRQTYVTGNAGSYAAQTLLKDAAASLAEEES